MILDFQELKAGREDVRGITAGLSNSALLRGVVRYLKDNPPQSGDVLLLEVALRLSLYIESGDISGAESGATLRNKDRMKGIIHGIIRETCAAEGIRNPADVENILRTVGPVCCGPDITLREAVEAATRETIRAGRRQG